MNNKRFYVVTATLLLISNIYSSAFAESVEQFLTKESYIRVNMSGGVNYGDQSNTANVMNHLRELGFTGTFEIVYADEIKAKLIALFGLPDNLPAIYKDDKHQYTFIEENVYFNRLAENLEPQANIAFSVGKGPYPLEDTKAANAKALINFSSYFNARGGNDGKTNIELMNDKYYQDAQYDSGKKFFIFPVATYTDARNYILNDPIGQSIVLGKPGLMPFLKGMDDKKFNVMFVYGRTLRFTDADDRLSASPSPSNILQVIAGARYAQLHGDKSFNKPLVIAIFDNYQVMSKQLLDLLKQDTWGNYEQPGAEKARQVLRELNVASALSSADLNDPASVNQINQLQDGNILLLSVGPLPKPLFDGLYNHIDTNIWPQVYEGAGTFSALNFTGRPRFECADTSVLQEPNEEGVSWTLGFNQIQNMPLKQRMQSFYSLSNGFCGSLETSSNGRKFNFLSPWRYKIHETLGQFIIEAMDERSDFSAYFHDVKGFVFRPEQDRVLYALEEVIGKEF